MIVDALRRNELVELMLREIRDLKPLGARDRAVERREPAGEQLRDGRLAVAVGAEQRDAVVGVDAQRQAPQHRLARLVADRHAIERDDRRRERLGRRRDCDRPHLVLGDRRDRAQLGELLHARLRLARLAGLRLEAVDEGLQMLALGLLLLGDRGVERLTFGALARERRVAAAIERELAGIEMQDPVDRIVEQVAVVADDDHGARIAREMIGQPQRAFEIEIVGRLVEQQQVGLGEQHRRERDAHAPAAGEIRARALLRGVVEAEAGEDRGGARGRRMRADVGKPRLDLGDAMRVARGLGFGEQLRALGVGGEHHVDQPLRPARRFLCEPPDARARRHVDRCRARSPISPAIARNSVVLPMPLRPTSPTRAPSGMRADAPSSRRRPAMRTEMSSSTSMARF